MELNAQQLWQIADEQKELSAIRARVAKLEDALRKAANRLEAAEIGMLDPGEAISAAAYAYLALEEE